MFSRKRCRAFARQHRSAPFDLVEGPEYGHEASAVTGAFPELPLVVRLHTPAFIINEMNHTYLPWTGKARFVLGGLRRGAWPRRYWIYSDENDMERRHALCADEIAAPSRAIRDVLVRRWELPSDRVSHVPNVFTASPRILSIPTNTQTGRITFLGKLEVRKGVLDLAKAIPRVLASLPDAKFRLVGRSLPHPWTGEDLEALMLRTIGRTAGRSVEFHGSVPYAAIPGQFAECDICVFPSVWENFPYVCLEAMAAARGVIASSSGGMAEIIEDGRTGLLVPPRDPQAIADAILYMMRNPKRRMAMGLAAREHVTSTYSPKAIGPLQEVSYRRAIEYARSRREQWVEGHPNHRYRQA